MGYGNLEREISDRVVFSPEALVLAPFVELQYWLSKDVAFRSVGLVSLVFLDGVESGGFVKLPHLRLMTKLLLYGYVRGVRSSRRMQRACVEDVAFPILAAGQQPDFRTIAEFRTRHLAALEGLFSQILRLCAEAGLVKLGHVAVDGTKIRANASKHKAMSYARMQQEEARLRAEIRAGLAEWAANDAAEDELYGPDRSGDELPPELADRKRRLEVIQEAKAALEAEAKQAAEEKRRQAESKGRKRRGRPPREEPRPKDQRNFTDPDSQIMLSPDKAYIQAYNAQVAVDACSQVIVAADVIQQANDKGQLSPMIEQVERNTGARPKAVSADAGYWVEEDVEQTERGGTEAFVAPKKYRHREWREATPPRGRIPAGLSAKEHMARKLRTKRGRAEYDKRKITAEPVCGQIKEAFGFRQVLLRGHPKARGEWKLVSTAHNLRKLFRSGWRPPAHGPAWAGG